MIATGSLSLRTLEMYKGRRRMSDAGARDSQRAFKESWSGDEEAEVEFPPTTCDLDLKYLSPWYRHEALSFRLFRVYKARQRAYRMRLLETPSPSAGKEED